MSRVPRNLSTIRHARGPSSTGPVRPQQPCSFRWWLVLICSERKNIAEWLLMANLF
jgi:hypothetical protein